MKAPLSRFMLLSTTPDCNRTQEDRSHAKFQKLQHVVQYSTGSFHRAFFAGRWRSGVSPSFMPAKPVLREKALPMLNRDMLSAWQFHPGIR